MADIHTALAAISRKHAEFWAVQSPLAERRVADEVLRDYAMGQIADDAVRDVPIYYRKSYEHLLDDAAALQQSVLTRQARRAATAKRPDALQTLIAKILQQNPNSTSTMLLCRLEQMVGDVEEVVTLNQTVIEFIDRGRVRSAKISGLKDRLHRARRRNDSR